MNDPAEEAAKRALSEDGWGERPPSGIADVATIAAREALLPLQKLRRQQWNNCINACCSGFECRLRSSVCPACDEDWPCATARLIYAEGEL